MKTPPAEREEPSGDPDDGRPRYTRRTVLRAGVAGGIAVGLGGLRADAGVAGRAAGQEAETPDDSIATTAAIRDQEEFDQDVTGFWIHLAGQLEPYEASVADQCAEIPWSDLEAMAFDAQLIDRTAEPQQSQVTVFLHDAVDVDPGDLFIVNEVSPCEGPYVVLELEQIGADAIGVGPPGTAVPDGETADGAGPPPGDDASPRPTTEGDGGPVDGSTAVPTEGIGPGPSVPAALAALLGGGLLADRLRDEE